MFGRPETYSRSYQLWAIVFSSIGYASRVHHISTSVHPIRRFALVDMNLVRHMMDIVTFSENRVLESGHLQEENYIIYWSDKERNQSRQSGVSFTVRDELPWELKVFPVYVPPQDSKVEKTSGCS